MDPQQKAIGREFDKYAGGYDKAVNDAIAFSGLDVDFFTRGKGEHFLRMLHEHRGEIGEAVVLDLGCGIGNYHRLIGPHVGKLYGADVSEESLEVARRINPSVKYSSYDGEKLPYADGKFDAVFTICVMHHVPPKAWPNFMREMHRVIKPGGIAAVYEHNPLNPLTRAVVNRCPFDHDAVLLWPSGVRKLMREAGFARSRSRSMFTVPPKGFALTAIDRGLGVLPFGAQYWVQGIKGSA